MLSSYRALLARNGARALALACALGWVSMCGYVPAIVLAAHAATGSFAVSGVVLAAFSVGSGAVAPLRGRAVDRRGPRVLGWFGAAHLIAGAAFATACALNADIIVLIVAGLVLGALAPPTIATARTVWTAVAGEAGARSAHALNAMLADLGVVTGPSLAGAVAVLASPALGAGLLIAGASGAAGLVARLPPIPGAADPRAPRGASRARLHRAMGVLGTSAGLRTLVGTDMAIGACLAGLEVTVIAIAAAGGRAALGVVPIAASALGSIAMTAWVGSRRSVRLADARYCGGLGLVALVLPGALISSTLPVLVGVLIAAGAGFGLLNAALFELLDGVVAAGSATEAFTWLTTSNAAGSALGAAVGGHLAQRHPGQALVAVAGCAALAAGGAIARRGTLQATPPAQGRAAPRPSTTSRDTGSESARPRATMPEALLIVDFQNDFTPGGALAVPHGDVLAGRINALAASGAYALVIATRDWHPVDHGSFDTRGGAWPVHCVAGTPGAELHPALAREAVDIVVDKGQDPATEGYSAFDGTELTDLLRRRRIDAVTVVGLATDYCVRHTALDALSAGFQVTVHADAVAGVEVTPGDSERALTELAAAGARIAA